MKKIDAVILPTNKIIFTDNVPKDIYEKWKRDANRKITTLNAYELREQGRFALEIYKSFLKLKEFYDTQALTKTVLEYNDLSLYSNSGTYSTLSFTNMTSQLNSGNHIEIIIEKTINLLGTYEIPEITFVFPNTKEFNKAIENATP